MKTNLRKPFHFEIYLIFMQKHDEANIKYKYMLHV